MKRLLKFETFVPRKVANRTEQAKQQKLFIYHDQETYLMSDGKSYVVKLYANRSKDYNHQSWSLQFISDKKFMNHFITDKHLNPKLVVNKAPIITNEGQSIYFANITVFTKFAWRLAIQLIDVCYIDNLLEPEQNTSSAEKYALAEALYIQIVEVFGIWLKPEQVQETFVPRQLATRDAALKAIQDQKLLEFNEFVAAFKVKLAAVQGLHVEDPQTQFLLIKLQGLILKTDPIAYPLNIFLFTPAGKLHFGYDWGHNTFFCEYYHVWRPFGQLVNDNLRYKEKGQLIVNILQTYFGFSPDIIEHTNMDTTEEIEDHFAA